MYQFFVDDCQIGKEYVTITGGDVNHIKNVLRMKPGEKIKKEVTFTNTGRGPMYVRACCLFSSKEAEEGARLLMGSSRWELAEDGYYYYTDIVNPKERTEVLLYGLTWESEEEITDFDLTVYTESVQAAGHENSREAFAHLMEREEGQEK